jgi:hypothetical protein
LRATVLTLEVDETFELDADQEAELLESIAEADRGVLTTVVRSAG